MQGVRTTLLVVLAAGALGWFLRAGVRQIGQELSRRPWIGGLLIWLLGLGPMIYLAALVRHYGVNVPTQDDWAMAPLIVKAHTGQLRFAELFQQQQEARTALPNLIFVLMSRSEWNVRDQMMISVIASWLGAAGLFVLLRRSGLNLVALAICFWLAILALFSPAPFELWLLASGFPSFLPFLFLVLALVTLGTPISTALKFLVCALLATASTFTLAHGLLAWLVTFPLLLLFERPPRWRIWLAVWLATAASCAAFYFSGYEKPAQLPGFAPSVSVLEYISFILQFLGGGLAYAVKGSAATMATIFALLQIALFVTTLWILRRRLRDRDSVRTFVPWIALALFAAGSAVLAALGRVAYGASYALASRYVPFSVGLTIAVIALVALAFQELTKRGHGRFVVIATASLIAGYLIPYRAAAANTLFFLRGYAASHRLGKSAVVFSQAIDTSAVIRAKVFPPAPEHVVKNAGALDDLKLLRPPLVRSNRLSAVAHDVADGKTVEGLCERRAAEAETFRASGWALLKAKGRPADGVVISAESPGAEPTLVAISDSVELRWEIARHQSRPNDYLWAGWSVTLPRQAVPPNAKLTFWAVDADEPRLYRLPEKQP